MSIQLEMVRTVKASQQKVFEAFTEESMLKQWFAPGEMSVAQAIFEKEVGGRFLVEMRNDAGESHTASGTVKEYIPFDKISYTWKWATPDANETLVTWTFTSKGEETEVKLLHEKFVKEEHRDHHKEGWNGCLDNFEKFINN